MHSRNFQTTHQPPNHSMYSISKSSYFYNKHIKTFTSNNFPLIQSSTPSKYQKRLDYSNKIYSTSTSPKNHNSYISRNKARTIEDQMEDDGKRKTMSLYSVNKKKFPIFVDAFKKYLHDNVYRINDDLVVHLNKVKKMKRSLSVEDYQHRLILNSNNILSKNSINEVIKSFREIRKRNRVKFVDNVQFIKKMEKKEKKIVNTFIKNKEHSIDLLQRFGHKVYGWEYHKIKFKKVIME